MFCQEKQKIKQALEENDLLDDILKARRLLARKKPRIAENEDALFHEVVAQRARLGNLPCSIGKPIVEVPYVPHNTLKRFRQRPVLDVEPVPFPIEDLDYEVETNGAKKVVIRREKKTRGPSGRQPVVAFRKQKYMDNDEIAGSLVPCCSQKCYCNVSFDDVKQVRETFWNMKQNEQADWLSRELALHGCVEDKVFKFKYDVNGKPCCATFLEQALPVSHGRLSQIRTRVREGRHRDVSPITGQKMDQCEQFIRQYAETHSEGLPNSVDVDLPEGVTKECVYIEYLLSFEDEGQATALAASLSWWYATWRKRCFHVKAKKWNRFSKCTTCSNIKVLRAINDETKRGANVSAVIH